MRITQLKTFVAVLSLALASSAALAAGPTAMAAKRAAKHGCAWSMSMRAPDHSPRAQRNWVVHVSLRPSSLVGHPWYEFYFNGQKVSTQYVNGHKHYHFRGHYSDAFKWPKRAIGIPLTLRVQVRTRCGTKHKDWSVKVRK